MASLLAHNLNHLWMAMPDSEHPRTSLQVDMATTGIVLDFRSVPRDNNITFGNCFTLCILALSIFDRPTSFRSSCRNGRGEILIRPSQRK